MAHDLEKSRLRLGMVPLIDAAPLVAAVEKGYFARHGLDVSLSIESSWASVRDKVAAGLLDAAHMLAPMPIAATLGIDGIGVPMLTALSLSLNGNAVTLSQSLFWRLQMQNPTPEEAGAALKRVLESDRVAGAAPRVFAHVFPFSAHHYELRYWLAGCGIDPDRDLQLAVIPPPQMVQHLRDGDIDGFCVGAPWGSVAQDAGIGRIVIYKHQIWNHSPEKVLGVTREWAARHPRTHLALLAALIETARWLDDPAHRSEAARLMVEGHYLDAPPETVHATLAARPADHPQGPGVVFHSGAATFPWISHAQWFLQQMRRWGQAPSDVDVRAVAAACYRPDLYREAARRIDEPCPDSDFKTEGLHAQPWSLASATQQLAMGSDRFFDGATFEPLA